MDSIPRHDFPLSSPSALSYHFFSFLVYLTLHFQSPHLRVGANGKETSIQDPLQLYFYFPPWSLIYLLKLKHICRTRTQICT